MFSGSIERDKRHEMAQTMVKTVTYFTKKFNIRYLTGC